MPERVTTTSQFEGSLHQQLFRIMQEFFLAVDTALFGQEHILSCSTRFVFDCRIEQMTLFYSICHATTGDELARFVFEKLKEFNVPFGKLRSVATDGAKSMIGSFNGMVPQLRRMINRENSSQLSSFKSVWCLAHRLNLVITDFQRVPFINSVFLFAKVFASKRKAVQYKKWLAVRYPNDIFRKIPKPSETKWTFYREGLKSLLTQVEQIDQFLLDDKGFRTEVQKMKPLFNSAGSSAVPPLSNPFVLSHFTFALFLLDEICAFNAKMQEENATIQLCWESVFCSKNIWVIIL